MGHQMAYAAVEQYEIKVASKILTNCDSWIGLTNKKIDRIQTVQDNFFKQVFQVSPKGTPLCTIRLDSQTLHVKCVKPVVFISNFDDFSVTKVWVVIFTSKSFDENSFCVVGSDLIKHEMNGLFVYDRIDYQIGQFFSTENTWKCKLNNIVLIWEMKSWRCEVAFVTAHIIFYFLESFDQHKIFCS